MKHVWNETAATMDRESLEEGHADRNFSRARNSLERGEAQVATTAEYTDWLEGHLKSGGKITHVYPYDTQSRQVFHIFRASADIPELHGASSLNVIVPQGVQVSCPELGHNELYFMDGFTTAPKSSGWVPLHTDVVAEMKRRGTLSRPVVEQFDKYMKLEEQFDKDFMSNTHAEDSGSMFDNPKYKAANEAKKLLLKMFNETMSKNPAKQPTPQISKPRLDPV
jgi:hypothetical protein